MRRRTPRELRPLARRYLLSVALLVTVMLAMVAVMEVTQRGVARIEAERDHVARQITLMTEVMLTARRLVAFGTPPEHAIRDLRRPLGALVAGGRCPRGPEDVAGMPDRVATLYVDGLPSLCFRVDRFAAAAERIATQPDLRRRDFETLYAEFPHLRDGLTAIRGEYAALVAAADGRRVLLGRLSIGLVLALLAFQAWLVLRSGGRMLVAALDRRDAAHAAAVDLNEKLRRHVWAAERAKADSDRANRLKDEFLARLSHEIRTPLNAVIGFSDLLAQDVRDPAGCERIDHIRRNGAAMLELFEDSLEIARFDAGDAHIDAAPFGLRGAVEAVAETAQRRAAAKGLAFESDIDPVLAGPWIGDRARFVRMLTVMLDNAVKFSDRGCVRFTMRPWGDVGLIVTVEDEGPGVPVPQREEVFRSFYQIDGSSRRRHGGLGQGLALARAIARAMGGEIGVGAAKGGGARFWLRLPMLSLGRPAPRADEGAKRRTAC
jgi:signal transduction histidine kinase